MMRMVVRRLVLGWWGISCTEGGVSSGKSNGRGYADVDLGRRF